MAAFSLKLVNWNACSIAGKQLETAEFLRNNEIDIASITETHLKPAISFSLPQHHVIRLDRASTAKGGVALAIKKGIKFKSLPSFQTYFIEAIGIEVITENSPIIIISAYCPKQATISSGMASRFKNDLRKLTRRPGRFILAGDLNARHTSWGSITSNTNGRLLADDVQHGEYLVLHPDSPTYFSSAGVGSTLDFFLTNIAENISVPQTVTALSSDHLPVLIELNSAVNHHRLQRKNYHQVDWMQFQRHIEQRINENATVRTIEDIDIALDSFTHSIEEAETRYIPLVPVTCKFNHIDNVTKRLISIRNTIRRQYQRSNNITKKILCKKLTKIIHNRLTNLKNQNFNNDLKNLPNHSKPFWRVTKILKNRPKPIPPLKSNEAIHITPTEKANLLANNFSAAHALGNSLISPMEADVLAAVEQLERNPSDFLTHHRVTAEEISNNIKHSRNMKAPGFDAVFNLVLKKLGPKSLNLLVKIFNACFSVGYFPAQWKLAKVIPILKPGKDPTSAKNYRPISLLSSLSKLFEKSIYSRLLRYTEDHDILMQEQFGFRRGHSTVHQLLRLKNNITRNKEISKTTVVALLDIEKAFDNVWHNGLLYKLIRFNFPTYIIKQIRSYLEQRSSKVFISGTLSDAYNVVAGVPQGSILGPLLYNLYISDIPPLPNGGQISLFADDTAIIYNGRVIKHLTSNLQKGLNTYVKYLQSWKVNVNIAKTQTIVFPHRNKQKLLNPPMEVSVMGQNIPWSAEVRYLGLVLDKKLTFRPHVEATVGKCMMLLNKLYPLITAGQNSRTRTK